MHRRTPQKESGSFFEKKEPKKLLLWGPVPLETPEALTGRQEITLL